MQPIDDAFAKKHAKRIERVLACARSIPGVEAQLWGNGHYSIESNGARFGYLTVNHHGDGRVALMCKGPPGASGKLAAMDPRRYHIPKYVGHLGWIGLWIDEGDVDWEEVKAILDDALRLKAAPKKRAPAKTKANAKTKPRK